jgi:hypothetical protein
VFFLDLRCLIGSPTDGSRLPSQQLRGGAWDPGALVEHARRSNWLLMTPTQPRAVRSAYRHSDHRMPKAKTVPGQRPDTVPACLLDPAATYNTILTALRSTLGVS